MIDGCISISRRNLTMNFFYKTPNPMVKNSKARSKNEVLPFKYPKPKILLVDLHKSSASALNEIGFNVSVGSFGKPYFVEKCSNFQPLIGSYSLPNYTEQEIIVIDLKSAEKALGPTGERHRPEQELDIWAKCDQGFIDPRARTAFEVSGAFDRILETGGIFVVFADARSNIEMSLARMERGFKQLERERPFTLDVWSFISELKDMDIHPDHGCEMFKSVNDSPLARLVSEHLEGSTFSCTLEGGYRENNPWVKIAENKFGRAVALYRCGKNGGSVIVLPQLVDIPSFLVQLFTNILPLIAPSLFPHIEQGKWTQQPDYELRRIKELKAKQIEVAQRAKDEISVLESELENERTTNGWIHDLLTGTGDQLVRAVTKALVELGFENIKDVDEERDREGKNRREDLQIQDQSPLLIIDIKGIGSYPCDDDALQAGKHAMIRMRELSRTDINGLSIINHQRHLPPLDRENAMPFRQELIDAAMEQSLGLMTAWDLYRLVINSRKFQWKTNATKQIFYRQGKIDIIPLHYKYIGKVAKVWTEKFGVTLEQDEIWIGESIAIEFPIEFEESPVNSILVNGKDVKQAKTNDPAGFLWATGRPKLREGQRVFRVTQN